MSSTGRRPMRSETRPHIGENTNCISENDREQDADDRALAPPATGPSEVRLGLPRHHRQHDAEAEQVDEHDQPDDEQGGGFGRESRWESGLGRGRWRWVGGSTHAVRIRTPLRPHSPPPRRANSVCAVRSSCAGVDPRGHVGRQFTWGTRPGDIVVAGPPHGSRDGTRPIRLARQSAREHRHADRLPRRRHRERAGRPAARRRSSTPART